MLAALPTVPQALCISFTSVILSAQLLRQKLCLLGKGGGAARTGKPWDPQVRAAYELPSTKAWRSDSGDNTSEPARVLDKPGQPASPGAACLSAATVSATPILTSRASCWKAGEVVQAEPSLDENWPAPMRSKGGASSLTPADTSPPRFWTSSHHSGCLMDDCVFQRSSGSLIHLARVFFFFFF